MRSILRKIRLDVKFLSILEAITFLGSIPGILRFFTTLNQSWILQAQKGFQIDADSMTLSANQINARWKSANQPELTSRNLA